MLILAFDTTLAACSVAVWRDGATLAMAHAEMERGQAEALAPLIDGIMKEAGVNFAALSRIAVTIGPGSFTGVRVGLATARGFGLALGIPVIGLTTGEVLQVGAATRGTVISVIDTKRGDFYVETFQADGTRLSDAAVLSAEAIAAMIVAGGEVTLVGDGAARLSTDNAHVDATRTHPDAAVMAALAAQRRIPADAPLPLYVRPPDVTMPNVIAS
jgi:tRNA threonylcarbamoyladenosine biosynthesis protein TsaB